MNTLKLAKTLIDTSVDLVDTALTGANCGLETVKDSVESLKNTFHKDYKTAPRIFITGALASEEVIFKALKDIIEELNLKSISSLLVQGNYPLEPVVKNIGEENDISVEVIQSALFIDLDSFDVVLYIGEEKDNMKQLDRFSAAGKEVFIESNLMEV